MESTRHKKMLLLVGTMMLGALVFTLGRQLQELWEQATWAGPDRMTWLMQASILLELLAGISLLPPIVGETRLKRLELGLDDALRSFPKGNPLQLFQTIWYSPGQRPSRFWIASYVTVAAVTAMGWITVWIIEVHWLHHITPKFQSIYLLFSAAGASMGWYAVPLVHSVLGKVLFVIVKLMPAERFLTMVSLPLFVASKVLQLAATIR